MWGCDLRSHAGRSSRRYLICFSGRFAPALSCSLPKACRSTSKVHRDAPALRRRLRKASTVAAGARVNAQFNRPAAGFCELGRQVFEPDGSALVSYANGAIGGNCHTQRSCRCRHSRSRCGIAWRRCPERSSERAIPVSARTAATPNVDDQPEKVFSGLGRGMSRTVIVPVDVSKGP